MRINGKIYLFILLFVLSLTGIALFFPKERKFADDAAIRIGAGNDISGVLMEAITQELSDQYQLHQAIDMNAFEDCCSNAAQWALNAAEINVGFFCNHIASYTAQKNDRVMIYAPVVMNAELIAYKPETDWAEVRRVGVTQGREQEKNLAKECYPQIERFYDISQKGILYAMEIGDVDADILDITHAARVPDYQYKPLTDRDYISYMLVVDKAFAETEAFQDFIEGYNRAVRRLSDPAELARVLGVDQDWIEERNLKLLEIE